MLRQNETSKTSTPFELHSQLSKIPVGETVTALKCRLKLEGNFSSSMEKHIIIVLDNSGSMGGSAIKFAKEGVKELIDYLHLGGNKKITLIVYNSVAQVYYLQHQSLKECKDIVDSVNATGRTSFCDAFNSIKKVILEVPCQQLSIVFFTDGQDTCNTPEKVEKDLTELGGIIQQKSKYSETHTIGFTSEHDALLLSRITVMGKNQGTFQYCQSSKDIPVCVDSIAGLVGGQNVTAKINLPHRPEPLPLDLEEIASDGKGLEYEALFYIDNDGFTQGGSFDLVVNIDTESVIKVFKLEQIPIDEEGKFSVLILQLGLIKSEVNKLVKDATNLKLDMKIDPADIQALIGKLEKQEKSLDKYMNDLGKNLKTSQRKDIFPTIQEIRDLIADFYAALRNLQKGQISNDTIASLNALAYKRITKKGLQKKLDKRTQKNVNLINDVYEKVSNIVSKIDFKGMGEKYADLSSKLGDCVLSCNSFVEALADEDCLCLTFDIGRSQAAIVDPTQILIKTVFPSFVTAGSFMYSAQFTIKKNEKAHGGFEKHAEGLIVKGAAQENITGVMPLYLCEENWRVAKLLMKPTLGWSATLDPLGYAYSQVQVIPFLILEKLLQMCNENPGSDFLKFQVQLVKETCIQIIKDGSKPEFEKRFSQDIKTIYDNYLKDPGVRTVDVVAHNGVFLCQLYCAIEAGLIEKKNAEESEEFIRRIIEEELRRKQLNWDSNVPDGQTEDRTDLLFKLFNIDVQKYIEEPLNDYFSKKKEDTTQKISMSTGQEYEKIFLEQNQSPQKVEEQKVDKKQAKDNQEEKKVSDSQSNPHMKDFAPVKFEYSLKKNSSYNSFQQKALQEYQDTLKRVMKGLDPLVRLFVPERPNSDKFKTWGIDNDTKFFCLYIQNKMHGKNWARREAVVSKNYKDPWNQDQEYMQFWYKKLVDDEKSKRITQFLVELAGMQSSANAQVFLETSNLNEAAGAFKGTAIGRDINHFYKSFCKRPIPLAREKIAMMISGHYKGVKLYKDAEEWRPSRTHGNAIWRMQKGAFSPEEWKALIPSLSLRFIKGEAKCPHPDERRKRKALKNAIKKKK